MQDRKAKELLLKYKNGQCTAEEKALLETWYNGWNMEDVSLSEIELKDVERDMMVALQFRNRPSFKLWPMVAAAAIALFFVSFGLYFFKTGSETDSLNSLTESSAPGGNKAVLILANGKRIDLQDAKSGKLATEGDVLIKKAKDGQLIYDLSRSSASAGEEVTYNAIETPRSGTYQVILPDGSAVWLNAASRIKFPSSFNGRERRIELQGEAYFEVAKDVSKPFRVVSKNQVIEVLGTHFNINSYSDEPFAKTTLLEGSVKVSSGGNTKIITPGEQAQVLGNGRINIVAVDTEQVIAWKNGLFIFKREDLKMAMRQIARWYNVEIEYGTDAPEVTLTGKIYRNVDLREALKSIGYLGVRYSVKGRIVKIETEQTQ